MSYNVLKEFVENTKSYCNYRISIYDSEGFLMFSNHENENCFDSIITSIFPKMCLEPVYKLDDNTVYSAVNALNTIFCILKVQTESDDIDFFNDLILNSLEARIELQYKEIEAKKEMNITEILFKNLIDYTQGNIEEVFNLAKKCKFNLNATHSLISLYTDFNITIHNTQYFSSSNNPGDLFYIVNNNQGILIKEINDDLANNLSLFKERIKDYVYNIRKYYNNTLKAVVTFPEHDYRHIKLQFEEINFLSQYLDDNEEIIFFDEYINDYLIYRSLSNGFNIYLNPYIDIIYKEYKNKENFEELKLILKSIIKNNFNLTSSAKELYMHKNTLLYKLNKFRECLGISDIHELKNQLLIVLIERYLNRLG